MTYRDLARQVPTCMGCRKPADGTIVLAHRNLNAWGLRAGRGIKTHDPLGAFLCFDCHTYGDGPGRKDSDFWELAVHRSLAWALDNNHLRVHCPK